MQPDELINTFVNNLYIKNVTYYEENNIVHKSNSICAQHELEENQIMYDSEQEIGLYIKNNDIYNYMENSIYQDGMYEIHPIRPMFDSGTEDMLFGNIE